MSIRKHAAIVVVSLTFCLAATLLSSVTAHCAEPQAEQVTLTPKHKSVMIRPQHDRGFQGSAGADFGSRRTEDARTWGQ
jgi:hypothetical protein